MKKLVIASTLSVMLLTAPIKTASSTTVEAEEMGEYLNRAFIKREIQRKLSKFYDHIDTLDISRVAKDFLLIMSYKTADIKALPSITVSQAALESSFGRSKKLRHNIFGIKARRFDKKIRAKTSEYINGKLVNISANFQQFSSLEDAIIRHNEIILKYKYETRDYREWVKVIHESPYATDIYYDHKLMYIIEHYKLYLLDDVQQLKIKL